MMDGCKFSVRSKLLDRFIIKRLLYLPSSFFVIVVVGPESLELCFIAKLLRSDNLELSVIIFTN